MESYKNRFEKISIPDENQKKLNAAKQEVEHIVDKLGLGIEKGIKETVIILRAMDFPTSSSCSGHTEKDKHSPPYVEIYAKPPEGWKEDKAKQTLWKEENLKFRKRLQILLDQYYVTTQPPPDARLYLANLGIFGGFRLEAKGTHMTALELGVKTKDDILSKIKTYQAEMSLFTNFLKEEFLKKKSPGN